MKTEHLLIGVGVVAGGWLLLNRRNNFSAGPLAANRFSDPSLPAPTAGAYPTYNDPTAQQLSAAGSFIGGLGSLAGSLGGIFGGSRGGSGSQGAGMGDGGAGYDNTVYNDGAADATLNTEDTSWYSGGDSSGGDYSDSGFGDGGSWV